MRWQRTGEFVKLAGVTDSRSPKESALWTTWWGPCVRRIRGPSEGRHLYLTFDDGPHPSGTAAVLDLLADRGVPATFFFVTERAEKSPSVLADTLAAGHTVGDHSLDHRWGAYFRGRHAMRDWIEESQRRLEDLSGISTVGFRAPAGVRTPNLHWALEDLGVPLVHWSMRFFDSVFPWTEKAAVSALRRADAGAIVLLHDAQHADRRPQFLATLGRFIDEARARDFEFRRLERELVLASGEGRSSAREPL